MYVCIFMVCRLLRRNRSSDPNPAMLRELPWKNNPILWMQIQRHWMAEEERAGSSRRPSRVCRKYCLEKLTWRRIRTSCRYCMFIVSPPPQLMWLLSDGWWLCVCQAVMKGIAAREIPSFYEVCVETAAAWFQWMKIHIICEIALQCRLLLGTYKSEIYWKLLYIVHG